MYNCHNCFSQLNTLGLIIKCLPQMVNKEMALVSNGSIQMCAQPSLSKKLLK